MEHTPLLREFVIVAGVGAAITVLLGKLRIPSIAGLLFAGAVLGPFGLALVKETDAIETLAEIGVILLLFTIGLEFSLERLRHIFRRVALGGAIQVFGTLAATAVVALLLGAQIRGAVFYGFLFALSSTAIVLRALSYKGELDAPHGQFVVGTLIFQDLCVVPMVLVVPALASTLPATDTAMEIGVALGKAALMIVGALAFSRFLVPRLLALVDASRSREVFLLSVLTICIGTAWLTSLAGLSLALGAFLGGLVVADTEYQHRAMGDIIPLRDVFMSVFFISLGMLFDIRLVISNPAMILLLLVCFTMGKAIIATVAAVAMSFPPRAAWLAGVGLAQFGEFGFVVLRLGESAGLVASDTTGPLLAAGIISMFLAPVLIRVGPHITAGEKILEPLTRLLGVQSAEQLEAESPEQEHVVVVGYGTAGQMVGSTLTACEVPWVALELNAETVRKARSVGESVYYADGTSVEALDHANIEGAQAAVVLINDPQAAARVVDTIKRVAANVPLLIRTRYKTERERLLAIGASDVVSEEIEASIEVLARLLRQLKVPRNLIDDRIREARTSLQTSDRRIRVPRSTLAETEALADLKIECVLITKEGRAVGRTLKDLDVRRQTNALVVAIRRGGTLLDHPDPEEVLQESDLIYLVGTSAAIRTGMLLLGEGSEE